MDFNALIDQLSFDLGSPLTLDEAGHCKLTYQGRLDFFLGAHTDPSVFYVYAPVMPLPSVKKRNFFKLLLQKHMLTYGTGGALFGVAPLIESIVLFRNLETAAMDYYDTLICLEQFVRALDFWVTELPKRFENCPLDEMAQQVQFEPEEWEELNFRELRV